MSKQLGRQVSDDDYRTLAEFRYRLRQFLHQSEVLARAAGVTPQQHQALLTLRAWENDREMTVGDLAERLQVKPHSALGLVQRLVAQNLVRRMSSKGDRRRVGLRVTEVGRQILASLTAAHRAELQALHPVLTDLLRILE